MRSITPFGTRDYLPDEMKSREDVLSAISQVFSENDFKKVSTPSFEYLDNLEPILGKKLSSEAVRFFDASGRLLMLRADHTIPVARMAASRMGDEQLPFGLYYMDSVFRRNSNDGDLELFQAGIEYIGESGAKADAKVIQVICNVLKKLGINDFRIDVGHTDIATKYSADELKILRDQDYVSFGSVPDIGLVEVVSDCDDLKLLDSELSNLDLSQYVQYNRGLIKDLSLYTGLFFEIVIPGFGSPIGSGGRYDDLIGRFGAEKPSVGSALFVNRILEYFGYVA